MNRQTKQFLIKLAIIIGVLVLSAFITSTYGYFIPETGDTSVSADLSGGVPSYYTYNDLLNANMLCANTHGPNGSSSLKSTGGYQTGAAGNAHDEEPSAEAARRSLGRYAGFRNVRLHIPGGGNGSYSVAGVTQSMEWISPNAEGTLGTSEITAKVPSQYAYAISRSREGNCTIHVGSSSIKVSFRPPWQQAGGLNESQRKIFFIDYNAYIHTPIIVPGDPLLNNQVLYADLNYIRIGQFLEEYSNYTQQNPIHTTTLGEATPVEPMHEYGHNAAGESVFNYIYAEAAASADGAGGTEYTPVQYANWYALGQSPTVYEPAASRGKTIYQEAKEYEEFLIHTQGKMEKEFIDVVEKGKIQPVEVSSDKEGNVIVGPFAVKYTEWGIDAGRGWTQFAGIYNAKVYTNDKPDGDGLDRSEYEFIYKNGNRNTSNLVDPQYPHSEDVFWIKIKKANNRTDLRGIHFDFRYLNVSGRAREITEKLYYYKWSVKKENSNYYIVGEEYINSDDTSQREQNVVIDIHGSRSYIPTSLDYSRYPVKLTLTKHIVNADDNNNGKVNDHNFDLGKTYKFIVTLHETEAQANSGSNPLASYEINLKDDDIESITYYVENGKSVPYYRVVEIDDGDPDLPPIFTSMNGSSEKTFDHGICGKMSKNDTIAVLCYNRYKVKSAEITLDKKLGEPAVEDEVYKLNLDIIEGANRILTDLSSALENSVELRVAKGETVAQVYVDNKPVGTSVTFKYFWRGDAPTYKVTEEENAKYVVQFTKTEDGKSETVQDKLEAKFSDKFNGKVTVDAINNRVKAKIRIAKNSDVNVEENMTFYFRIQVGKSTIINEPLTIVAGTKHIDGPVHEFYLDDAKNGDNYVVTEYPDEKSMLEGKDGTIVKEDRITAGDSSDEAKYTVTAENKIDDHELFFNIKKTFTNSAPTDNTVFTFDTDAIQKYPDGTTNSLGINTIKASSENNWTTETVIYRWKHSTPQPEVVIKENQDTGYFIKGFKVFDENGNELTVESGAIAYTIDQSKNTVTLTQYPKDSKFTFEVVNDQELHAELKINKMIKGVKPDDDKEYAFDFLVRVKRTDGTVTEEKLTASNKELATKTITWKASEGAPTLEVYEIKQDGFNIGKVLINNEELKNPQETSDGIALYNETLSEGKTEILIDVENEIIKAGTVNIVKHLKDVDGNDVTDSAKVFTFDLFVDYGDPSKNVDKKGITVPVGGSYSYTATWTDDAPKYKVTEIEVPGYEVENVNVNGNDKGATNTVEGSFNEKDANDMIVATYTNREVKDLEGDLTITKTIASTTAFPIPENVNRTYSFDVVIKQDGEEKHKETVTLNVSGKTPSASKTIKYSWKSNTSTPTYEVKENNTNPIAIYKDGVKVDSGNEVTGELAKNSKVSYEYVNGIDVKSGRIRLRKVLESGSTDISETFYFNVNIAGENLPVVPLKAGDTWESEIYTWVDDAPEFKITEAPTETSRFVKYESSIRDVSISGTTISGRLAPMNSNNDSVDITCINDTDEHKANVKITKKGISNTVKNVSEDDLREKYGGKGFVVDVSVVYDGGKYYVGNTEYSSDNNYKTRITIDVGRTKEIPEIRWFGDNEGPKVIVNEVSLPNDGWTLLNYDNNNVVLAPNSNENITIENQYGNTFLVIPMGGTVWADTYKIEKNTGNSVPNGKMDGDEVGIPNVGVVVKRYLVNKEDKIIGDTGYAKAYDLDGNQIEVFPIYTDETGRWDVRRLEIPGVTPEEAGKGVTAIKYGVEYVYDGYTYEPTIYIADKDNYSNINNPIETENATAINRAQKHYDIKQTPVSKRNSLIDRSFALDNASSRTDFNNRFALISGDTPIANDNSTSGYAIGTNGSRMELKYTGTQVADGNNTRLVSELVTTDDVGRAYEQYQVTAYTLFNKTNPINSKVNQSGLAYPFDLEFNVAISSRNIDGDTYIATDPYLRNVNLGLVKRDEADLEVTKNVESAKVIVNQRLTELSKVSALDRLANKNNYLLEVNGNGDQQEVSYELGLYRSDYYYRAQAYATSRDIYNGLKKFYKEIQLGEDFEALMNMQAYVTYRIDVRNSSSTTLTKYDVVANSIMDYADSSLELVRTRVENYIKTGNDSVGSKTLIAEAPYYMLDGNRGNINVGTDTLVKDTVASRDYYRTQMTFDNPVRLEPGKTATIYATYRLKNYSQDENSQKLVNADSTNGAFNAQVLNANADGIILGDRANVAELKAYSIYKHGTNNLAGKVDRDSAPNNIDIASRNNKAYYEDDTYKAPVINVKVNDNTLKTVSGTVWEDNEIVGNTSQQAGVALGDGIKSDDEKIIRGMNVELVEKIQIPTNNGSEYMEYDFTWPENYDIEKNIVSANDVVASLKNLTGFDSTISSDENGAYTFTNMPTGAYVVRFHYGDINGDYNNESVTFATGSKLLKSDVYKFPAGGDNMMAMPSDAPTTKTAHYDGDMLPAVYNGHDFKSAVYALGLSDEWLGNDTGTEIKSKAVDSQARRLELVNKAKVLVNANTSLLDTANDIDANHNRLYEEYSMFADTPKIQLSNVESVDNNTYSNVNFGIVERPETRLVLDKEIEEISLLDNTEKELIRIKYNIDYDVKDENGNSKVFQQLPDGSFTMVNPAAAVTVNEAESFGLEYLQSLSKIENKYAFLNQAGLGNSGVQNFRYIVYDTSMATSLTLKTTYRLTALNLGQADRTSAALQAMSGDDIYAVSQILKANKFSQNNQRTYDGLSYGNYKVVGGKITYNGAEKVTLFDNGSYVPVLGYTYYSNSVNGNDAIVNTKVGQIIDYIDNGLRFDQSINTADNNSWYSTTDDYLYHNDVIDKNIFQTVNYNVLQGDAATSETKSKVMDKAGVYYDTTSSHNIVLSVQNSTGDDTNAKNTDIMKRLLPKSQAANTAEETYAFIKLNTTRSIDSQAEDLIFDNIAEIIKYENDVGRKTTTTVAGNADPKGSRVGNSYLGEFSGSLAEIDSSATEIITFSEPYGISERGRYITEISIGVLSALVIIAAGIVIVKKKVL